MRVVDVNGAGLRLAFEDTGAGPEAPAVLLVHGLGGHRGHWERVIPALAARRRVIAVDLPGFGGSARLSGAVTLDALADALAALLDALEVRRAVFVGHSMGGPLGTVFAHRHPQRVVQLVMVCGTIQSFQRTLALRLRPWLTRPLTALVALAELFYVSVPLPPRLRPLLARVPLLRAAMLWPFVRRPVAMPPGDAMILLRGASAPGVLAAARAIARSGGWERLPLAPPVSLINGDHDLVAPLADLRAYPGPVKDAVIVKGTAHVPMLEDTDAFLAALGRVLES